MAPVVSIIGHSGSGKTTLIEKLIKELNARDYSVATVKHAPHGITLDQADKDSQRHIEAGSEATAVSSPEKLVLVKSVSADSSLDEIVRLFGEDHDIVLAEGFKQGSAPKIEVHRQETGPLLTDIKKLFAIATDEPVETKVRQFSLDDIKGLADLLEEGFIKPQRERLSLYVNGVPIALSGFPREFISKVLIGMATSLKGVGDIRSIEILLRKEPNK